MVEPFDGELLLPPSAPPEERDTNSISPVAMTAILAAATGALTAAIVAAVQLRRRFAPAARRSSDGMTAHSNSVFGAAAVEDQPRQELHSGALSVALSAPSTSAAHTGALQLLGGSGRLPPVPQGRPLVDSKV